MEYKRKIRPKLRFSYDLESNKNEQIITKRREITQGSSSFKHATISLDFFPFFLSSASSIENIHATILSSHELIMYKRKNQSRLNYTTLV